MFLIDYNSVIQHQYDDVNKSHKKIDFYFRNPLSNWWHSGIKRGLNKTNTLLISQLLSAKGISSDVEEKMKELKDKDLNEFINLVNNLIKANISLKSKIEELVIADKENKYPELHISDAVLTETIEHLYNILRILKRQNKKTILIHLKLLLI